MSEPAPVDYATPAATAHSPYGEEIVARPDNWYRGKRLAFAIALILAGPWFAYDGWINWPRQNEEARKRGALDMPHNETSLLLQKVLAITLPPLGIAWLARILYTSRGVYRLRGETLSVPGHPEMPITAITQINLERWDRKGIAVLDYDHAGQTGRFALDDFIYLREPTDQILDRIKTRIAPEEPAATQAPAE